jgi:hypothetical protein
MKIGERVFVQCACHGPSHIMEVELGTHAGEPELTIWYMLNPRLPLRKRLVTAALYVLGRESLRTPWWLAFDEFHLNADGVTQLKDACDTYLEVWRRRMSKEEFGRRLRDMVKRSQKEHVLAGEWAQRLSTRFGRSVKEIEEEGLCAPDFPMGSVQLQFEDDSCVTFENAFFAERFGEVAVFTEHCGYHVFDAKSITCITVDHEEDAPEDEDAT